MLFGVYMKKIKKVYMAEKLKLDIKKSIYLTFVNEDGSQERLKLKEESLNQRDRDQNYRQWRKQNSSIKRPTSGFTGMTLRTSP